MTEGKTITGTSETKCPYCSKDEDINDIKEKEGEFVIDCPHCFKLYRKAVLKFGKCFININSKDCSLNSSNHNFSRCIEDGEKEYYLCKKCKRRYLADEIHPEVLKSVSKLTPNRINTMELSYPFEGPSWSSI